MTAEQHSFSRRALLVATGTALGLTIAGMELGTSAPPASATIGPWGGYSNGQIPLSALRIVSYPNVAPIAFPGSLSAVYLKPDAADALLGMLSQYHVATGGYLSVNEGYRTLAGQQYWWDYWGHNPAMAAPPGTSNHGYGVAFDFDGLSSAQLDWVRAHCGSYGYSPISSEDWHFDFSGSSAFTQPQGDNDQMIDAGVILYLYQPTNDLILADHMNRRLRKINQNTVERRQFESLLGQGRIFYVPIDEPAWTQMFSGWPYTG